MTKLKIQVDALEAQCQEANALIERARASIAEQHARLVSNRAAFVSLLGDIAPSVLRMEHPNTSPEQYQEGEAALVPLLARLAALEASGVDLSPIRFHWGAVRPELPSSIEAPSPLKSLKYSLLPNTSHTS